ncbi:unnamed protein product [Paramecium primaurelia]|uniref:P-type Ca(2+) transporter n=1 Tax=Paramecium primaurelia TaxID=5886 RepID=A0A8S1M0D1_PARPR|nr:unnamed protein product [Paramecium primaurelia]
MAEIDLTQPFYSYPIEKVVSSVKTDLAKGLSNDEAKARLAKYGTNELEKEEKESIWEKIKEQFEDNLVRILLLAAVISFVISQFEDHGEVHAVPPWVEPCVIFTILILNAAVGIWQDLDAERAIEALKDLQSPHAIVLRDSNWGKIEAKDLVVGDIVEIKQGDRIPADLRMVELKTITLKTDQSILTGEVNPVNKTTDPVVKDKAAVQDKINFLFSGTLVSNGTAIGIVCCTGMKTEIGKIQKEVQEAAKEKQEDDDPLSKRLDEFGDKLAKVVTYICIGCWLMNISNFSDPAHGGTIMGALYYFKVAVALAVAAIPEGLPAVITTCLALGARRMAKQRAIVRKLPKVQTLGCTTIICSDKTGTLTTNEMCVKEIVLLTGREASTVQVFPVEGTSYHPEGKIEKLESTLVKGNGLTANLKRLAQSMALCNESKLFTDKGRVQRSGLPTEAALRVLVEKIGKYDKSFQSKPILDAPEQYNEAISSEFTKRATLEFTRDRKSMSVLANSKNEKGNVLFIKGAPDYLLEKSNQIMNVDGEVVQLKAEDKAQFLTIVKNLAEKGLRTLAICVQEECGQLSTYDGPKHPAHKLLIDTNTYKDIENKPIIIGVVALQDPPRPEVKRSIEKCREAGISVIMITGDIKETAQSIAMQIGILHNQSQFATHSFTGLEFSQMGEEKQKKVLTQVIGKPSGLVFSRTDPSHKRELVKLLTGQLNQIAAMTGDGVNDAPALKQASIGIAMGIAGTEVAKEASDMILADDNFATIVRAVEEGRAIYQNMKGFIRYMISSNIGEVVSIFTSSLLGIPDGFNSIQLLWVNLVTDGLPATALSFNPPDPDVMQKPPRKHDEPIITEFVFIRYCVIGTYVGLATVFVFVYFYLGYEWAGDGHPIVTFTQLRNWGECHYWEGFKVANFDKYDFSKDPCLYFSWGKQKASTLSLSVLVVIEMFNALNALSEDSSLLKVGVFANPYLIMAIFGSMTLHCMICYVPLFENIFNTVPLTLNDWILVLAVSAPVVLVDEILKVFSRIRNAKLLEQRKKLD